MMTTATKVMAMMVVVGLALVMQVLLIVDVDEADSRWR